MAVRHSRETQGIVMNLSQSEIAAFQVDPEATLYFRLVSEDAQSEYCQVIHPQGELQYVAVYWSSWHDGSKLVHPFPTETFYEGSEALLEALRDLSPLILEKIEPNLLGKWGYFFGERDTSPVITKSEQWHEPFTVIRPDQMEKVFIRYMPPRPSLARFYKLILRRACEKSSEAGFGLAVTRNNSQLGFSSSSDLINARGTLKSIVVLISKPRRLLRVSGETNLNSNPHCKNLRAYGLPGANIYFPSRSDYQSASSPWAIGLMSSILLLRLLMDARKAGENLSCSGLSVVLVPINGRTFARDNLSSQTSLDAEPR